MDTVGYTSDNLKKLFDIIEFFVINNIKIVSNSVYITLRNNRPVIEIAWAPNDVYRQYTGKSYFNKS
jgi:hypothetical protein